MPNMLTEFQKHAGLSATNTAKLLGYARSSYYQLLNSKELPLPTSRCVEAMMALSKPELRKLISKHVGVDDDDEL
jgi:hypothetical protein